MDRPGRGARRWAARCWWLGDARRRRSGLVAPPASLTAIKIAFIAAAGIGGRRHLRRQPGELRDASPGSRGSSRSSSRVLVRLDDPAAADPNSVATSTRSAATPKRRVEPGSACRNIRTLGFVLGSVTAGIGGILLGSFFYGQFSTNTADPGQLVLYAVAGAVIGGTSLFGGRGKAIHGVLGGLVIGGIAYGMALLGLAAQYEYIVTGAVLVAAVLVDVLSRRGSASGSAARV